MSKKILICVDIQNDFITGSLAVKGTEEMVDRFYKFAKNGELNKYNTIIVTQDWHPVNHISFKEYGGDFPSHCVKYTAGSALNDKVVKSLFYFTKTNVEVLKKGTEKNKEEFSIIQNDLSGAIVDIYTEDSDEIDICGIADKYCVKSTIEDLIKWGYKDKIVVLLDFIGFMGEVSDFINWLKENNIKFVSNNLDIY